MNAFITLTVAGNPFNFIPSQIVGFAADVGGAGTYIYTTASFGGSNGVGTWLVQENYDAVGTVLAPAVERFYGLNA